MKGINKRRVGAFLMAGFVFFSAMPVTFVNVKAGEITTKETTYKVIGNCNAEGGTVEVEDAEGNTITSEMSISSNENCTVTATANEGYEITSVSVETTGNKVPTGDNWWQSYVTTDANTGIATFEFALEGIEADYTFEIGFTQKSFTISYTIGENGKLILNSGTGIDTDKVILTKESEKQTSVGYNTSSYEIMATVADAKYHLTSFKVKKGEENFVEQIDAESICNALDKKTFTIPAKNTTSYVVEVTVAIDKYNVIITSNEGGTIASDVGGQQNGMIEADAGTNISLFIKPDEDKILNNVSVNGQQLGTTEITGTENQGYVYTINNIASDYSISVEFGEMQTGAFADAGIEVKNQNGSTLTAENNTFYAEKVILSAPDGYEISYGKYWGFAEKIEIYKSTTLNSLYIRKKGDWWNSKKITGQICFEIDHNSPELSVTEEYWASSGNKVVTISGKVKDNNLAYVAWSTEQKTSLDEIKGIELQNYLNVGINGDFQKEITLDKTENIIYIYAVDKADHYTEKAVKAYLDDVAPVATAVTLSAENGAIHSEAYGLFANSELTLSVTVNDVEVIENSNKAAGIHKILVYAGTELAYQEVVSQVVHDNSACTLEVKIPLIGKFQDLKPLSIIVEDALGNQSKAYMLTDEIVTNKFITSKLMLEQTAPSIAITLPGEGAYINNNKYWYKSVPDIPYAVSDMFDANRMGSGLKTRSVFLNGNAIQACEKKYVLSEYSAVNQTENTVISAENLSELLNGENTVGIQFTDMAGNTTTVEKKVYLDTYAPVVKSFEVEVVQNKELTDKILHMLTFGNYTNEKVEITVQVEDVTSGETVDGKAYSFEASGVECVTLQVNGKDYETTNVSDGCATFVIPKEELGDNQCIEATTIAAYAKDNVGNISESQLLNTMNSNLSDNSSLMIENICPVIEVQCEQGYVNANGDVFNNQNTEFEISVNDKESGLYNVAIEINGCSLENDTKNTDTQVKEDTYKVSTGADGVQADEEGKYTLNVNVTDNAGNTSTTSKEVYLDETAPQILRVEMQAEITEVAEMEKLFVEEQNYGYFFKEDTKLIVSATDGTRACDSGVKSICYYTVDVTEKMSEVSELVVNEENEASFIIPAGFKGQVYVCAFDQLGNYESYVTPNSLVIETKEMHDIEEHITFEKTDAQYKDKDGKELYANDVAVNVTVTDMFSGIQTIEWEVKAPQDAEANQNGIIRIDENGEFETGSNVDGWTKTKTEKNLVTELQKTISVTNNSNDITLFVKMTDNAGNTSEKEIEFSIDKTIPVIEISFDNENPDAEYTTMYKEDRTATITVTERNFNAEEFEIEITNPDGESPKNAEWQTQVNEQNPDETKNITTVKFADDGDYTITINGHDRAHNMAETMKQEEFTIDKTEPVITVSYDNENAINGNYFAEDRTATIQIEEHNFTDKRVRVSGKAVNGETEISFPVVSGWTDSGDIHTATIVCDQDALYQFNVEFMDEAGNKAQDYVGDEFYVDLTSPEIEIIGVTDMSANNGDVMPQVIMSDINYDTEGVTLELIGANNGQISLEGGFTNQGNGQIYSYQNFPYEQSFDDIYTLRATIADMAGNESMQEIHFSVNRFGSVYVFDDSLKEIAGKYINEELDVKLTEINVDSLEHDSIKVVIDCNGTSNTLTEGVDYSVLESGGNGTWYQYDYIINKELFAGDGRYIVTLYSEDLAGNVNQNINETKQAEISFGIDKTAPVIIPIDVESEAQYAVDVKNATVTVNDNLILENVKIYIDNSECEYAVDGENYTFDIPSGTEKKDITVVAEDAAGNKTNYEISEVLVTTNAFVRWYNNTPLFVGTIATTAGAGAAGAGSVIFHKKWRIKIRRRK